MGEDTGEARVIDNAGMKTCVAKANKKGLRIGVHTLSTFFNNNDPYVTPIADKRLSMTGSSVLTEKVSATKQNTGGFRSLF